MDWCEDTTLQLIDAFRRHPSLWDPTDNDYSRRDTKADAWEAIGKEFNLPAEHCKRKMRIMMAGYRREKIKARARLRARKRHLSKWFAFEALKFLDTRQFPKKKDTNESSNMERDAFQNDDSIEEDDMCTEQLPTDVEQMVQPPASCKFSKKSKNCSNDDVTSIFDGDFVVPRDKAVNLDKKSPQLNETDAFFTYVAIKVNNYNEKVQKHIQHAIFDILMKADTGYYDPPEASNQHETEQIIGLY